MPRTVTISLPSDRTDGVLSDLEALSGLLTLSVQRGVSVQPPGDVITAQVTNHHLPSLMQVLDGHGAGDDPGLSVTTSKPTGMFSASASDRIATNSLHLVVGAMVIAPGFQPLVRVGLGVVGGSPAWRRGLLDTAKGYAALVPAAGLTALLLRAMGTDPLGSADGGYLPSGALVRYWDGVTLNATIVTIAAGVGGALLIAANRSVLTAGVMIALALVPSAALVGVVLTATAVLAPIRIRRRRELEL